MAEASVAPKTNLGIPHRLLRQQVSGHIYQWTETLAKRSDMVPYDSDTAKRRIETLKRIKADAKASKEDPELNARLKLEMKEASDLAKELTDLENQIDGIAEASAAEDERIAKAQEPDDKIMTDDEIEAKQRSDTIDNDPHIKSIMEMRKKADVEAYILTEYGEEVPSDSKLEQMKNQAITLRTERLFEGDEG